MAMLLSGAVLLMILGALFVLLLIVIFILACEGISEGGIGATNTKATKDEMLEMLGHRKEKK